MNNLKINSDNLTLYHGTPFTKQFKKTPPSYSKPFFMTDSIQCASQFSLMDPNSRNGSFDPFYISKINKAHTSVLKITFEKPLDDLNMFNFSEKKQIQTFIEKIFGQDSYKFFNVLNSLQFSSLLCLQGQSIFKIFEKIPNIAETLKKIDIEKICKAFFFASQIYMKQSLDEKLEKQYLITEENSKESLDYGNIEKTDTNIEIMKHIGIISRIFGGLEAYYYCNRTSPEYEDMKPFFRKTADIICNYSKLFLQNNVSDINAANIFLNKLLFNEGFDGYISKNTHEHEIAIFKDSFFDMVKISELELNQVFTEDGCLSRQVNIKPNHVIEI